MQTTARYFDGKTAASSEIMLQLVGRHLTWNGPAGSLQQDIAEAKLIAPVGRGPWRIELTGGGSLEIADEQFANEIQKVLGQSDWAGRLERSWKYALIALVTAIGGFWILLTWGVPAAARHVAFSLPPNYDEMLANDGLGVLDGWLFEPTLLDDPTQARLQAYFADIKTTNPTFNNYQLVFRSSEKIGANAFAVPGGLVIMTDEMVELADADEELIAVLAHEVGHQANRHSLRILLQSSATAVLFAALTGDLTSVSALSATLPTVLVQAKYSRDFEREADEFAFDYLEKQGIDTNVLSDLLLRLEDDQDGEVPGWLSSHPQSSDRTRRADK